ncbi:MAG: sigma-54-dependent Fis family transcriptional regulator [Planctomycetes bacterium]|nr:sigma-54-dependent Fis family transcriptional regulator [Planctomycetota bacterium]
MTDASLSPARVLIADDEIIMRQMLSSLVKNEGLQPLEAEDGKAALRILNQHTVDLALLDIKMPGMDGLEVLREARKLRACPPIIMITAFGSTESAVTAIKSGAYHYLTKPLKNEELIRTMRMALDDRSERQKASSGLFGHEESLPETMGSSPQISRVFHEVQLVAPTDYSVLVTGETGSGKEMIAQGIHQLSLRAAEPFVPVDCGSIPPTLIERELFGHERGAFTGADRTQPGKFEAAAGGTLFLDEISNLPLDVQPKLLRALQERQIWRIGGTKCISTTARVVAATNQDLASLVGARQFRRDLFHRLNEFSITVPPLRDRRDDIAFLAQRFLRLTAQELRKDALGISDEALQMLQSYSWPGNVRELRNVIRRAALMAGQRIETEHLCILDVPFVTPASAAAPGTAFDGKVSFKDIVRRRMMEVEREILTQVLQQTRGNKAKAARILQIDYKTLHKKAKDYGISPKEEDAHGQKKFWDG